MKIIMVSLCLLVMQHAFAQKNNWQNFDLQEDSVFGISTKKAIKELLNNREAKPVLVAIIDNGIDTAHPALKSILWRNRAERPNSKDDDKNGYADDMNGWNFIGGKNENVNTDNLELTRLIRAQGSFYDSLADSVVPDQYLKRYEKFTKMKKIFFYKIQTAQQGINSVEHFENVLDSVLKKIGNENPSSREFSEYIPANEEEKQIVNAVIGELVNYADFKEFMVKGIRSEYNLYKTMLDFQLNLDYDPRKIVGDNYSNKKERYYGNNDVMGSNADHGTHVAGIIGARKNDETGIGGVADNVKIIFIRVVPDGDERDKDVANAIRYAADNGAKIINMSFGKPYSPDKSIVDDAVKYAVSKDVLLVHAAGNDHKNLDANDNFPNRRYADSSGEAKAWIEVGASGWKDDKELVASFSNYGKTTVDVFAPGLHIYSTVSGSKYEYEDGTSMATPVVTGLAALIRGYYPKLTAVQVNEIIMQSVVKRDVLKDRCVSGGVVNAYNALKLAATYK